MLVSLIFGLDSDLCWFKDHILATVADAYSSLYCYSLGQSLMCLAPLSLLWSLLLVFFLW